MEIFSISNIIGAFINSFAYIFIWSKLLNKNINFKSYKYYVVQIIFAFFLILNFILINSFIKVVVLIMFMMLLCYFLFREGISETITVSFLSEILIMVSELLFIIFVTLFLTNDVNEFVKSYAGSLIANVSISIIAILLVNLKYIRNVYEYILKVVNCLNKYNVIFVMVVCLLSINFVFASTYERITLDFVVAINLFISCIYLVICFKFFKAENKYTKINDKYNNTLNSLKEYEDILDVYRVSNHENKNQLLMIRNMIIKGEKDIPEYIDKIIDNKIKDDEKLMFDTNKIPAGGLRAVVYSKLLVMKDEKIDFNLIVDRKVRTVDLIELGENLMLDVCRITGVFLDNAIEEVKDKENKRIIVELFTDEDELCIKISNNFSNTINIEKIYDKGYTTKTNGHGYGLSLVKEITDKNKKLTNLTSIEKDMFTQLLKIKLK